jgi:hypothetical protein
MYVISFDVGIRNLAECHLAIDEGVRIEHWSVTDIARSSKAKLKNLPCERVAKLLLLHLHSRAAHYDAFLPTRDARVVIENQPPRTSTKLKAVQHMLYAFFAARYPHVKVSFASPRAKLAFDPSAGACAFVAPGDYRSNKQNAVEKTEFVLSALAVKVAAWDDRRKRDDLADALIQAMAVAGCTVSG